MLVEVRVRQQRAEDVAAAVTRTAEAPADGHLVAKPPQLGRLGRTDVRADEVEGAAQHRGIVDHERILEREIAALRHVLAVLPGIEPADVRRPLENLIRAVDDADLRAGRDMGRLRRDADEIAVVLHLGELRRRRTRQTRIETSLDVNRIKSRLRGKADLRTRA